MAHLAQRHLILILRFKLSINHAQQKAGRLEKFNTFNQPLTDSSWLRYLEVSNIGVVVCKERICRMENNGVKYTDEKKRDREKKG